jgi:hypothetical protein
MRVGNYVGWTRRAVLATVVALHFTRASAIAQSSFAYLPDPVLPTQLYDWRSYYTASLDGAQIDASLAGRQMNRRDIEIFVSLRLFTRARSAGFTESTINQAIFSGAFAPYLDDLGMMIAGMEPATPTVERSEFWHVGEWRRRFGALIDMPSVNTIVNGREITRTGRDLVLRVARREAFRPPVLSRFANHDEFLAYSDVIAELGDDSASIRQLDHALAQTSQWLTPYAYFSLEDRSGRPSRSGNAPPYGGRYGPSHLTGDYNALRQRAFRWQASLGAVYCLTNATSQSVMIQHRWSRDNEWKTEEFRGGEVRKFASIHPRDSLYVSFDETDNDAIVVAAQYVFPAVGPARECANAHSARLSLANDRFRLLAGSRRR